MTLRRLFLIFVFGISIELSAEVITPQGPVSLFTCTNLDGFYTWLLDTGYRDPRNVFTVTNGMIRISGERLGYLATKQRYSNYRLIAEFRWGGKNWRSMDAGVAARDSGIFLHATGPDGNSHDGKGAFKAALECQIMEGAVGDILLIRGTNQQGRLIEPSITATVRQKHDPDGWYYYSPKGLRHRTINTWGRLNWVGKDPGWKDVLNFRGDQDVESHGTNWTTLECVCDGRDLRLYVNGQLVNAASNVFPSEGQILLQCEGAEIFFRKLELRPLKK